ncbi:sperm acrosome associated 6 [Syngnathus typhle]|uniref:sperm acrosome associated 6 n=1 Tax=Syngnathus typhle TaxID=161592 RepID=UPI002A6A8EFD|nr:sperm acrosome associated 6 [Syngnathus typhle]
MYALVLCLLFLRVVCDLYDEDEGCSQCLVKLELKTSVCLKAKDVGRCFEKFNVFNSAEVVQASRVEKTHVEPLKAMLATKLKNLDERIEHNDPEFLEKLQSEVDDFIAEASKMPRGFQDGVFNCIPCRLEPCDLPLDCPVQNRSVEEGKPIQMLCEAAFKLPPNTENVWRFADFLRTQEIEMFEDVVEGKDNLFAISSATKDHQGTYQCEVLANEVSVVRIYYFLKVIPPNVKFGHSELEKIFQLSLLPGENLHAASPPPSQQLPSIVLISFCFTSLLLLFCLTLG